MTLLPEGRRTGIVHMPTTQEHIKKQNSIQITLSYLQQAPNNFQHADWVVTLAFYKALHAVDSYLVKQGLDSVGHSKRNRHVQNHLQDISEEYNALYRASRRARYDAYTYQDNPQAVTTLVNDSVFIEEYINTLLESP